MRIVVDRALVRLGKVKLTMPAHGLYANFGLTAPLRPITLMERYSPDLYRPTTLIIRP
jgi:hypothetical protein